MISWGTQWELNDAQSKKDQEHINRFTQGHLANMETTEVVKQDAAQAICQTQLEQIPDPCSGECGFTLVEYLAVSGDAVNMCRSQIPLGRKIEISIQACTENC